MKISNRTGIAGRDLLTVRRKGERVTVHLGSNSRALATVSPDEVFLANVLIGLRAVFPAAFARNAVRANAHALADRRAKLSASAMH